MKDSFSIGIVFRTVAILLAVGIAGGCGSPGDSGRPRQLRGVPHEAQAGTIHLSLPIELRRSGDIAAAAVDTPRAQSDAEVVEILVIEDYGGGSSVEIGDTPTVATTVTILLDETNVEQSSPVSISVPAGDYYLLVLVGTLSGSTSCLLASGYTDTPVTVEPEQRSEVTIDLTTISHEISIPNTILAGSSYTITATGNTNNAVLTTESHGSTDTYGFQAKFDTDNSLQSVGASFTGTEWVVSYTSDAPSSESDVGWYTAWEFAGPYVTYHDERTGAWTPLDGEFSRKWRWLSKTVIGDNSQLWSEVFVPVTVVASATGVDIEVTW